MLTLEHTFTCANMHNKMSFVGDWILNRLPFMRECVSSQVRGVCCAWAYVSVCASACVCVRERESMCVCACACAYVYVRARVRVCRRACVQVCMHIIA